MIIAGRYSFNKGFETIKEKFAPLLEEVESIVAEVDASKCKTKKSKEKTMPGRMLYNPKKLNAVFHTLFLEKGWSSPRVKCEYANDFYADKYEPKPLRKGAFRQMDFVKDKLGVEIQFGKLRIYGL